VGQRYKWQGGLIQRDLLKVWPPGALVNADIKE
jgi:hypothetical protein